MKKLILAAVLLLLCFVSKAQTKDSLIKLYNNMVRIEKLYCANERKMWQKNANSEMVTPKEDSFNVYIENARWKAHGDYNDYWFRYHEKRDGPIVDPYGYGTSK